MKNKWTVLAFLCGIFVVYTVDRALIGLLAIPIQKDLGLSDLQLGFLGSAIFWTYAAVVPFAGLAGDRFNRAKLIGLATVSWSAMAVLAGFTGGFASLLLFASIALVIPQTLYSPTASALIASVHKDTQTMAMSCHQAAFYTGWFISGASVAVLLSSFGIRAFCVTPGPVLTRPGMTNMKTLQGRQSQPVELVDFILYLASENGASITGSNHVMDCGRLSMQPQ